jgi:hypothetical protein
MKKSKFSQVQIAYALRQVESGSRPADMWRRLGVSEATFYIWEKKSQLQCRRPGLWNLESTSTRGRTECELTGSKLVPIGLTSPRP